jgi:hypothetical protein
MAEDPQFVDIGTGDFHLKDISPCIGAGINSLILNDLWFTAPTFDIEGNPRPGPQNSNADMGAFENHLGTPVTNGNDPTIKPCEFKLFQNFPNPFNESTTFTYQLSIPCSVELSIYNLYGQNVAILVSENQPAGLYKVQWDAGDFISGQYIYRLETDKGMGQSRKLLLLK